MTWKHIGDRRKQQMSQMKDTCTCMYCTQLCIYTLKQSLNRYVMKRMIILVILADFNQVYDQNFPSLEQRHIANAN